MIDVSSLGDRARFGLINFPANHEQRCCGPLELAVVAGHHIDPGELPDYSSCFGDYPLAVTAFQIRGRVIDDVVYNQIREGGHNAILRRASCHLLRGKTGLFEEFVRNLLRSATPTPTDGGAVVIGWLAGWGVVGSREGGGYSESRAVATFHGRVFNVKWQIALSRRTGVVFASGIVKRLGSLL